MLDARVSAFPPAQLRSLPCAEGLSLCPEEPPGTHGLGPRQGGRCEVSRSLWCPAAVRVPASPGKGCSASALEAHGRRVSRPARLACQTERWVKASISHRCSPQKFSNWQINSEMVAVRELGAKEMKYSGRASALWSHITACYSSSSAATHLITTETFINDTEKQ